MVGRGHLEIDPFLAANGLTHLDVLHSDIQGVVDEMLDSAQNASASRKIDYLFISKHSELGHKSVLGKVHSAGFRVEVSKLALFDGFRPLGRNEITTCEPTPGRLCRGYPLATLTGRPTSCRRRKALAARLNPSRLSYRQQ